MLSAELIDCEKSSLLLIAMTHEVSLVEAANLVSHSQGVELGLDLLEMELSEGLGEELTCWSLEGQTGLQHEELL